MITNSEPVYSSSTTLKFDGGARTTVDAEATNALGPGVPGSVVLFSHKSAPRTGVGVCVLQLLTPTEAIELATELLKAAATASLTVSAELEVSA